MADHARALVQGNNMGDRIEVRTRMGRGRRARARSDFVQAGCGARCGARAQIVHGRIEEIELKEKVDVIVSEPLGFLLVHERMLESFVTARERFLKPGGLMMPSRGTIHFAPFTDEALHTEQLQKAQFWTQNFYGIDLRPLADAAMDECARARENIFSRDRGNERVTPRERAVATGIWARRSSAAFRTAVCCARRRQQRTTRSTSARARARELRSFEVPFSFVIERTALMHGLGCWFDVCFEVMLRGLTTARVRALGRHNAHRPSCLGARARMRTCGSPRGPSTRRRTGTSAACC